MNSSSLLPEMENPFKALMEGLGAEHDRVLRLCEVLMKENLQLKERNWTSPTGVDVEEQVPTERLPNDGLLAIVSNGRSATKPTLLPDACSEANGKEVDGSLVEDTSGRPSKQSGVTLEPPSPSSSLRHIVSFATEQSDMSMAQGLEEPPSPQLPDMTSVTSSRSLLKRSGSRVFSKGCPQVATEWTQAPEDLEQVVVMTSRRSFASRGRAQAGLLTGQEVAEETACLQRFVMKPHSVFRLTWDLLSVIFLLYDVMLIPLEAFSLEQTLFLTGMDWTTVIFWTLDIFFAFFTGFHREGIVEMRPRFIAKRYLKTWFFMDAFVVTVDWTLLFLSLGMQAVVRLGKTNRVARLSRIMRTVRIIRSVKLHSLVAEIFEYIKSDLLRTLTYIWLMLNALLIISHYLACGWYGLGTASSGASWVSVHGLEDEGLWLQYLASLHWSLTQFTPASMEIYPTNADERLYAICVVLFGIVTFSSFVSSITSGMMTLQKLKTEPAKQEAILRQYFKENSISAELGQRIWTFLKQTYFDHRSAVNRRDIAVLRLLPESLRGEMSEELFLPFLDRIPFFERYYMEDSVTVCEVIHRAMVESSFITGDDCFNIGKSAEKMYMLTHGTMDYWHRERSLCTSLGSGDWVSEAALWLQWQHCGDLRAHTCCEIVLLDCEQFRHISTISGRLASFLRCYAQKFHGYLINSGDWYTDVWLQVRELRDVVIDSWQDSDDGVTARSHNSFISSLGSEEDAGKVCWFNCFSKRSQKK